MRILSLAIMQRAPMQILWLILVSLKKVHAICKHCQSFAFERDFEIKAHLDVYCSELVFQNSRTFSCLDFIFRSWYKCLGSRMVYPEWQDIKELKKINFLHTLQPFLLVVFLLLLRPRPNYVQDNTTHSFDQNF